jgi:transposase
MGRSIALLPATMVTSRHRLPHSISGETFWSVSNGVSKPFFAALLALFAREAGAGRERMIVLGLDSAGWHTEPNLVVPDGIRLAYLPPYSPELQPAEHLWPVLDEPLANQYFETLADLERAVAERCLVLDGISSASGQTSTGGPSRPSRANQPDSV